MTDPVVKLQHPCVQRTYFWNKMKKYSLGEKRVITTYISDDIIIKIEYRALVLNNRKVKSVKYTSEGNLISSLHMVS